MEYLRVHQLDLMLVLIGICLILAIMAFMTKSLSRRRKALLMSMELGAMFFCLCLTDLLTYTEAI